MFSAYKIYTILLFNMLISFSNRCGKNLDKKPTKYPMFSSALQQPSESFDFFNEMSQLPLMRLWLTPFYVKAVQG